MLDLIEQHRTGLLALCRQHEVRQLELFGSAASGAARPNDLDFLVVFDRAGSMNAADRFLGLQIALEDLFGMKVDLVDVMAHRNPYFMADALKHRVTLYAAA